MDRGSTQWVDLAVMLRLKLDELLES